MVAVFGNAVDLAAETELCEIMGRYGSDKSQLSMPPWHNYTHIYHSMFSPMRNASLNVFELGIGTVNKDRASNMGHMNDPKPGASIRGWKEYFASSMIFAGDYDPDVLFHEDRIQSFFCDQTQPQIIQAMWNCPALRYRQFDIILDDANHQLEPNACFLENSIHKLADGGIYIIEDVVGSSIPLYEASIQHWRRKWPELAIELVRVPFAQNAYDNNLVICRKNERLEA